jgi:hypothetical protein
MSHVSTRGRTTLTRIDVSLELKPNLIGGAEAQTAEDSPNRAFLLMVELNDCSGSDEAIRGEHDPLGRPLSHLRSTRGTRGTERIEGLPFDLRPDRDDWDQPGAEIDRNAHGLGQRHVHERIVNQQPPLVCTQMRLVRAAKPPMGPAN